MTVYALILYVCTVTASSGWPSAAPFDRYCEQAGHNSGLYTTLAVCQAFSVTGRFGLLYPPAASAIRMTGVSS